MSERFKEGQRFSGQGITVTGDGLTWREAKIANAAYQQGIEQGRKEALAEVDAAAGSMDESKELLELAWGLIANATEADWDDEASEWRRAAERWRDSWLKTLPDATDPQIGITTPEQEEGR